MFKALNYWVFGGFDGQKSPEEFIDWAARQGLDGVEFSVGDNLKIDITEKECRRIADYAHAKGIALRSLASGGGWACSIASPDPREHEAAMDFTRRYLHIASWLGAETILVVPGATRVAWEPDRPEIPYRQVWDNALAAARQLAPLAEKLNVSIGLENVWNRFLLSPMEWKLFLDAVGSDHVGMYFDVGNVCLFARPEDYPEILGSHIKAVHLKNFTESDCAGGLHGFGDSLLEGAVNFRKVFAELDKIGYKGPFTVEMIPFSRLPDLVLPDQTLAETVVRQLKSLE